MVTPEFLFIFKFIFKVYRAPLEKKEIRKKFSIGSPNLNVDSVTSS